MDTQTVALLAVVMLISSLSTWAVMDVRRRVKEEKKRNLKLHRLQVEHRLKSVVVSRHDPEERREVAKAFRTSTSQQNIANRITNFLKAAAKLNPTYEVNPLAEIVVNNIGCIGESTTHQIFVGWKNQHHTIGIVQILIRTDLVVWSESPSKEAEYSTSARPSDREVDVFSRNVAEFVRNYNRRVTH